VDTTPASQDNQTEAKMQDGDCCGITAVLEKLLNSSERQMFTITVEGGKLLELRAVDVEGERRDGGMQEGWISMETAAKRLAHGYHWLCRNWRELGLHRRQIGRAIFFREADIAALIERQRPSGRGPGRPRKVIGIIS
jgi:hypothetical protein